MQPGDVMPPFANLLEEALLVFMVDVGNRCIFINRVHSEERKELHLTGLAVRV